MTRAMNKRGKKNFSLGNLFFELAEGEDPMLEVQIQGTEEE